MLTDPSKVAEVQVLYTVVVVSTVARVRISPWITGCFFEMYTSRGWHFV